MTETSISALLLAPPHSDSLFLSFFFLFLSYSFLFFPFFSSLVFFISFFSEGGVDEEGGGPPAPWLRHCSQPRVLDIKLWFIISLLARIALLVQYAYRPIQIETFYMKFENKSIFKLNPTLFTVLVIY